MANIVEFLVKIRDLASGPMRTFAYNSEGALNRLSNRMTRVGQSADQLGSRIDQLTKTRELSINTAQIKRANQEIEQIERKRNRLQNLGRSSNGLLSTGLALAGFGAAAAVSVQTFKAGMERQMNNTSFEILAGKKQGGQLSKNLTGYAADTVYGNEVFGEAKTLLGFGVATKNVMPVLNMLGDIALGNAERMQALSLAFAQTTTAGKLMGQDLLQYSSAGFNPLQALAQKTGKSMAYFKEQMTKGKISTNDVVAALQFATGPMGKFYEATKKLGEKDAGKIAAFGGALSALAGTVGEKILPFFGQMAEWGSGLLNNIPTMYGIAAGVGAMTAAWGIYTIWTQRAAIWQGILAVAAYWPLALVGATAGAITYLCVKYDSWGKSAVAAWNISKAVLSDLKIGFVDFGQTVAYAFEMALLKVKNVFETAGAQMGNLSKAWDKLKHGDFAGAKKALTAHIETDADKRMQNLTINHSRDRANNQRMIDLNSKTILAQSKLIHFDIKGGKSIGKSPMDYLSEKVDLHSGKAGAVPGGVADASKGIAGGGVRNITINIAKQGIDNIHITTATLSEGVRQIEQKFIEMFNQVVNSGASVVPAN